MGRILKRVPLDFAWPLNEVWRGYKPPARGPCPLKDEACFDGVTADRAWLGAVADTLTGLAQAGVSQPRYGERSLPELGWAPEARSTGQLVRPTTELARFVAGLGRRRPSGDLAEFVATLDSRVVAGHLQRVAGLPDAWGLCPACGGDAHDPADRAAYAAWTPTDPPAGDGYQCWETTSEGAPVSPVFPTLDALTEWLSAHHRPFGKMAASAEEWRRMLETGTFQFLDKGVAHL